jgi:NAD(P)H-hydrate epimerase
MGRIDADAIERLGIPGRVLMETAGRAVAEVIMRHYPRVRRPLVACGAGNNGGDGFVVARVLREWNAQIMPVVLAPAPGARQSPEARANDELLLHAEIEVVRLDHKDVPDLLRRCDLIVDAVFGVGLSRDIEGPPLELLRALDASALPVVAVDLPSGLSGDRGTPLGVALRADRIVTLGLPKLGLAVQPQSAAIDVADIGLPASSIARAAIRQRLLTPHAAAALLPPRPPTGHKGSFGHVLVAGGSPGKTGAVALAAEGALRTGAGLVTAAVAAGARSELRLPTEAMSLLLPEDAPGLLGPGCADELLRQLSTRSALVLGPGLGLPASASELVRRAVVDSPVPVVIDADGLNAVGTGLEALQGGAATVLTPHPGEAARLLGQDVASVQADRPAAVRALAARSGGVAVLKGARSLISDPEGSVWINPTGGPGLGTGGTGDVLAGVIGALLAQGLAPWRAAVLGTYLHGAAGDRGPSAGGLAREVAARIPEVWRWLGDLPDLEDVSGRIRPFP